MIALLWFVALLSGSALLGVLVGPWLFGEKCGPCAASRGTTNLHCSVHGRPGWRWPRWMRRWVR